VALIVALTGCSSAVDRECGFGTEVQGDTCVTESTCGAGTTLTDGECLADAGGSATCGANTVESEEGCVPLPSACESPTQFDSGTGQCVGPERIVCGAGTELVGSVCVLSCPGDFELPNLQRTGCVPAVPVVVVHAAADAGPQDFSAEGELLEDNLSPGAGANVAFGQSSGLVKVLPGVLLGASNAGSAGIGPTVAIPEDENVRYMVVFQGRPTTGTYDEIANPTATLALALVPIPEQEPFSDGPRFFFYHAVPDAALLSGGIQSAVGAVGNDDLFAGLSYGELTSGAATLGASLVARDLYEGGESVASFQTASSGAPFAPEESLIAVVYGFKDPFANTGTDGL
ncbi:MAG: hypothetical protein AAFX94_24155, partial [Myxococcota bacterium]